MENHQSFSKSSPQFRLRIQIFHLLLSLSPILITLFRKVLTWMQKNTHTLTHTQHTETVQVINALTENYKCDPSQAQWLTVEINNNLLVTFFFIIYFPAACALNGVEQDGEQGRGQHERSWWPWKLIKNRCSDGSFACTGGLICVCVSGYWLLIIISPLESGASPS